MSTKIPAIDYVIACEGVRPELANKLSILGFYGVLPHAHIRVGEMGKPIGLVFLVNTHGGRGSFKMAIILKHPDSSVLLASLPAQIQGVGLDESENANEMVAFAFPAIIFKDSGQHAIEVLVNDMKIHQNSFLVGSGLLNIPAVR